jgi:hypothetical protein
MNSYSIHNDVTPVEFAPYACPITIYLNGGFGAIPPFRQNDGDRPHPQGPLASFEP